MKLLDLTLPTPAENVALDEALLEAAEGGESADEVLRLWDPERPMVVVGRSSRVADEVNQEACRRMGVPILRRASGGAAIVTGPGCLMYGIVLRYEGREHLRLLDQVHQFVLKRLGDAVRSLVGGVEHAGTSDLAIGGRKFSGNSARCKHDHLLYHGTLLYDFDLSLIDRLLRMPPRQPDYRAGRSHHEFLMNLPLKPADLKCVLAAELGARQPLHDWPRESTQRLVAQRYALDAWTFQR
jgi:lipoate-protein ligase A